MNPAYLIIYSTANIFFKEYRPPISSDLVLEKGVLVNNAGILIDDTHMYVRYTRAIIYVCKLS